MNDHDLLHHQSKVCIKIKIRSSNPQLQNKNGSSSTTSYHVCDVCGRAFSSGKAWGGHKRHHVVKDGSASSSKKMNIIKIKMVKKDWMMMRKTIKAGEVRVMDGKPVCCLCGKIFPSMNSLFGHMRFHPGRGWKGIQPPISKASGDDHDRDYVDLTTSLPSSTNWSKTDPRGRVSVLDPIPQAARSLITLSTDSKFI